MAKLSNESKMPRTIAVPRAVVAQEFSEENVRLREAWVGTLRDSRDISRIIGKIGKLLPSMSHLKRCSARRLVLAFAPPSDIPEVASTMEPRLIPSTVDNNGETYLSRLDIERLLADHGIDISLFEKEFEIVRVPCAAPKTKVQALAASKIWPLNFHPDPTIESIIDGSCFEPKHLSTIDLCMRVCIEAASKGDTHGSDDCDGSAVIYDPINDKIMAIAASRIDRHPMWHAAILAIDLVARLGNGGAYELGIDEDEKITKVNEIAETESNVRKRKYSQEEIRQPPLAYPGDLVDIAHRLIVANNDDKLNEARKERNEQMHVPYLCTNCWIFLLREPCALCAMALVHSRVSEIFYGITNESHGVLGSRAMLHTIPGLNHRYRVWRGIREEECRSIFDEIIRRRSS